MAVDLHIAPDPGDLAVGPDQNRGAKNSQEGLAIHGFFAPGAVGLQHLVLSRPREGHAEAVLVAELLLGL